MSTWLYSADGGASLAPHDSPWIETPFPVVVRGTSDGGERFCLRTVLDGLSSSCLSLRLQCALKVDRPLFVVVSLRASLEPCASGLTIAVRGRVTHADERPGGAWRITLALTRYRFLYRKAP